MPLLFDALFPKLRESLSVKTSFDVTAKLGPIQEFRYWQAVHSCAATGKLLETSDIPFFQNLADSFSELGKESFLVSTVTQDIDFASRQILDNLAYKRGAVREQILDRIAEAKRVPGKLRHINRLIELGDYKSAESALAGIKVAGKRDTFPTSQKLLRAKGMRREAEVNARRLFLDDPDYVIESGEPPHFLFKENGGLSPLVTPIDKQGQSANSIHFHCIHLILRDKIAEAVELALIYTEKSPLPKWLAILIANAVGRLDLPEAQRAELHAIQELPLIPLQPGQLEPRSWFPRSVQRAVRQTPPPADCLALSSWAVSLLSATKTANGCQDSAFPLSRNLEELASPNKQDPIRDALLRDGYTPIKSCFIRHQFSINDRDIYEEYMSERSIARIQTKRAKKFLQEATGQKSGTVLFSFHASSLCSRDIVPIIAAARQGMNAFSLANGATISDQNMRPEQSIELSRLPVRALHRSATPSTEITGELLANLRCGGVLDVAVDVPRTSGVTAMVPWLLRPISVPVYPVALATSLKCKIGISATWVGPSGELINDIIAMELPAEQGDTATRSLWLAQKLGRSFRNFAKMSAIPIATFTMRERGGAPSTKNHVPLIDWSAEQQTAPSLVNWLAEPLPKQRKVALKMPLGSTTFDELQGLILRMASVLLHYQTEKPEHDNPDRDVGEQHRVMLILPQGPVFMASTLASLAVGSLVALSQDDLTTEQLGVRYREFKPDLMIVTASTWTRFLAANPSASKQTVLIVDDRGDQAALDDLVFSFPQADHLPPMQRNAPGLVIFTSGSTGKPKGVVHPCDALSANKDGDGIGADVLFGLSQTDKLTYIARWDSVCFLDILSALRARTQICVPAPETLTAPSELGKWLTSEGVTCFAAPSTVFGLLLQSDAMTCNRQPKLRLTMPWGERISNDLSHQLYRKFPDIYHIASYGASEALWVAIGELPRPEGDSAGSLVCPGGFPIGCVDTAIVDEAGNLVEQGETGNPRISGSGVMLGYLDDLLADTRKLTPSSVILQDFARLAPNGSIELMGRSDSIIKIAGRRISLLEIEAAAEMVAGAREALAFIRAESNPPQILVAVAGDETVKDRIASAVADSIAKHCFASARPAQVLVFENFPRLPSGKRDRKAVEKAAQNNEPPITEPSENNTVASVSNGSSLLSAKISNWASRRLLNGKGGINLADRVPRLDSLMVMELMLIIEETCGAIELGRIFNQDRELKWKDLLEEFEHKTPQEAE